MMSKKLITLKDWREARGYSQDDLAELLGCQQTTVSSWENGIMPRKPMLEKIIDLTKGKVGPASFL